MQLSVRRIGQRAVVAIPGPRLDAATAPEFKRQMVELIDHGTRDIVLDFAAVDFLDSSGLGAVVGSFKHLGSGGRLELAGLRPAVRKIFALTRMDRVFAIHESAPAA